MVKTSNVLGNDDDFVSLGFKFEEGEKGNKEAILDEGGVLVVEFDEEDYLVKNGLANDSFLVETTGEPWPEETGLVEVHNANAGPDEWVEVGEATNEASGEQNTFEIPTEPVDKVRITDTTDETLHGSDADGLDVKSVSGYTT
ncbi:MAG: hypothetical protein U5K28_04450 [Halobacteriales archaeon]|nr:hypothetical protein [Halobacteriales archaeon]